MLSPTQDWTINMQSGQLPLGPGTLGVQEAAAGLLWVNWLIFFINYLVNLKWNMVVVVKT